MNQINYFIDGGLTSSQLEMLHEKAMTVLGKIGLEVANPDILEFFKNKPGFKVVGSCLRFDRALLEECVQSSRQQGKKLRMARPADEPFTVEILSSYPTHLDDWRSHTVRPMLEKDVVELTRLVDRLYDKGVRGSAAGVPQDVPPEVRDIRCYRIGAENCRGGGWVPISSLRSAEWLYRLHQLMEQPFNLDVFVVNPLRAEGQTFDLMYHFGKRIQSLQVACMPMMGVTAPVQVMGAFVQALASVWGAYAMARELTGLPYFGVECRIWPVDMRTLEIVYGTPEMVLSDLITGQLREFYGWFENDADAFHSSAIAAGQQAAAQRGAYGMAMALAGRRHYRFGGLLAVDFVFSPVQLLLDVELLRYYQHVVRGFEFSEDAFCMDSILSVGTSGSFLGEETTGHAYRDVLWRSNRWVSASLPRWQEEGQDTFEKLAQAEIERLIRQHDFHLPEDKARQLDRLCKEAEADLL